jgi:hypothetical protein
VRQIRKFHPPINVFGLQSKDTDPAIKRFNTFGSILSGVPASVTPGIYLFTYGFKMGSTGTVGNCVNKNLLLGVTTQEIAPLQPFNYFSRTESYSIDSVDQSTWQTFSNSIVLIITTYTGVFMNVQLLNLPLGDPTDTYIYDVVGNYFQIGDV